jgi:serine/threonine protein kinase
MASDRIACPNCGVENAASDTVCFFCRHRLSGSDTAPTTPAPSVHKPPTMHSAPTQAAPSQPTAARPASSQSPPAAPATARPAGGPLPAQALLNRRYRVVRELGHGGMGAVYLAQDTQLGNRLVAVKEMSQNNLSEQDRQVAVETFKREAYLLAGLQHPNLPSIHEHFEQVGHWYLVMSFIQGESLANYLERVPNGRLPLAEVLHIARELCDVLNYLHGQQPPIIFRDLKPSNIMRTPDGHIYLIDFGIARLFKPGQSKDTASYGSMGYSPPEQYGRAQTNARSDIYSLGVTLYELLSGYDPSSSPFRLPPLQSLVPGLPERLTSLIMQMVEMDESKRPASIRVVQQALF